MANLQATIRGQALAQVSAATCVTRANKLLRQNTEGCNFITFFYAVLNHRDHQLAYVNAGHNPPALFSGDQTHRTLATRGLPLGIHEHFEYREETIALQSADAVVMYSDGVVEATNSCQEEFGEARLIDLVRQNLNRPAGELIDLILQAVKQHAGSEPQADDITLVVMKRV